MAKISVNNFFGVLGNKQRFDILQTLHKSGEKSVSEICSLTGFEQSAVSHNLRRLLEYHFVDVRCDGRQRVYRAVPNSSVERLISQITEHINKSCQKSCQH